MVTRIAVFDSKSYTKEFFEKENAKDDYGFELDFFENRLGENSLRLVAGHEIICAFVNDDLSKPVIDKLYDAGVRLIAMRCAGYNNVDLKAVYKKIHVVRVPAYSPYAVAEHTSALMLCLSRKIHRAYWRTRDNNFSLNGLMGFDFHGKTVGVIGTGKIGKKFINICLGYGMKVLAYDKYPDDEYAKKKSFTYVDLEKLLKESDVISLNCPLNHETYHLIDKKAISLMKKGVMILNTGRGKLIDTVALIEGLKSRKIGSAGLDVYEEESQYFFEDWSNSMIEDEVLARLLSFNNVIVTSHQGFFTREALSKIASTTFENIKSFLDNRFMDNEICYRCDEKPCRKETEGKCF